MTNEEAIKILEKMKARMIPLGPLLEGKSKDEEAVDMAIKALSKQCASSEQAYQCGNNTEMVDHFREVTKKTDEESISKQEALTNMRTLCDGCYLMEHCGQCNSNCLLRKAMDVVEKIKTDSERVSLPQPEKSNSFSKESPEEVIHEMNYSDVPVIRVGKTDFKPGDKFILELGEERNRFGDFRIKGTDLYVETYLLEKLTRYEPKENKC